MLSALIQRLLVEHAQHRVLAVDVRHDRNAKIDRAAAVERLEATVLRHAPLGDVELREHFHSRDRLLGLGAVVDGLYLREDAVDPEFDHEPRRRGFEMDVARAEHERVAKRRAHEAHHVAFLFADRPEGKVFDAVLLHRERACLGADRIERMQRRLVARHAGHEVAPVNKPPGEGGGNALLGPGFKLGGERIVRGKEQRAVAGAQRDAALLRALGKWHHVERRRGLSQLCHRHGRNDECAREPVRKGVGFEAELLFEDVDQAALGGARDRYRALRTICPSSITGDSPRARRSACT